MTPVEPCTIALQDVDLDRGGRPVLRDVTVTFRAAVITAIVGPSGAGKTSLLRCINGLERPDRGSVLLDGRDARELPPTDLRRRVGMIFQTPVLFEGGVRANLAYGLRATDGAVLGDALDAVGLATSFLGRESSALSVGQAQRVCIARALVRGPQALLLDEPTASLDKDAAARIEGLLGSLRDRGLTLVMVTHNLEQARRVAEEAVLIVGGRIEAVGEPSQIEAAWPEDAG